MMVTQKKQTLPFVILQVVQVSLYIKETIYMQQSSFIGCLNDSKAFVVIFSMTCVKFQTGHQIFAKSSCTVNCR